MSTSPLACFVCSALVLLFDLGCMPSAAIPSPAVTVDAYARALERGDVDTLHQMTSDRSRRALSKGELKKIMREQRAELIAHAKALRSPNRLIRARAEIRFADGEVASLDWTDGRFRVTAADALPAAATTPVQALSQLKRVLARRSYAGLLRVLSPRTRAAIERDLDSLVTGLSDPRALPIAVVGDAATVKVPGGHVVRLQRRDGIWHVDDFD